MVSEIVIGENVSKVPFHELVKDYYTTVAEHGPLHATVHAKQRGRVRRIYVSALQKNVSSNIMVDVLMYSPSFEVVSHKNLVLHPPTSSKSFLSYVDLPKPEFVMQGEEVTIDLTMTDSETGGLIDVIVDQREPFIPLISLVA